jgi:beta-1,4-glucosyltransferase
MTPSKHAPSGRNTPSARPRGHIAIAHFDIRDVTFAVIQRFLIQRMSKSLQTCVLFANANFVVRCHALADRMKSSSIVILPDGVALDMASKFLHGRTFRENLNGTDFTPRCLKAMPRKVRVYLAGATPESLQGAAAYFASIPNIHIVGTTDGFSLWENEAAVLTSINGAKPDILLVALGNPLQEEWILDHAAKLNVSLIFGVGALFDFLSGHQIRAPEWVRLIRCEWLYRLLHEPRRLIDRYTIGIIRFAALAVWTH